MERPWKNNYRKNDKASCTITIPKNTIIEVQKAENNNRIEEPELQE